MKELKSYKIVIVCEVISRRSTQHFKDNMYYKATMRASAPDAHTAVRNCIDMLKFTHNPTKMYVEKVVRIR